MAPMDRRVARTRRLLGAALLELVQEAPYDSITIRDITERADVGYATFFRHYGSKEDLLTEKLEVMIRDLEDSVARDGGDYFAREGEALFYHALENEQLYRVLLGGQVHRSVFLRLRDALAGVIRTHLTAHPEAADLLVPLEVAVNHLAVSALELVAWWLEHDRPYPPAEMGGIYDRLVIRATWQAIFPVDPHTRGG